MLSRTQYNNIEGDFQMREDIGVFSVRSGEGVGKRGGCRVLIITYYYNMCMFHHRWGWWGLLPVLQRVMLVTAIIIIRYNQYPTPPPPLFPHPLQNPLKTQLRLTSPGNPTPCYYCVLLNINIVHVFLLFAINFFVLHYCYCELCGSHNA